MKRIPFKFLTGAALVATGIYLYVTFDGKYALAEIASITIGAILCALHLRNGKAAGVN